MPRLTNEEKALEIEEALDEIIADLTDVFRASVKTTGAMAGTANLAASKEIRDSYKAQAELRGLIVAKVDARVSDVTPGRQLSPKATLLALDRMRAELAAQVEGDGK